MSEGTAWGRGGTAAKPEDAYAKFRTVYDVASSGAYRDIRHPELARAAVSAAGLTKST